MNQIKHVRCVLFNFAVSLLCTCCYFTTGIYFWCPTPILRPAVSTIPSYNLVAPGTTWRCSAVRSLQVSGTAQKPTAGTANAQCSLVLRRRLTRACVRTYVCAVVETRLKYDYEQQQTSARTINIARVLHRREKWKHLGAGTLKSLSSSSSAERHSL